MGNMKIKLKKCIVGRPGYLLWSVTRTFSFVMAKLLCKYQPCSATPEPKMMDILCDMIKGMSQMSGILILSYRLKEVTNSYVLHCFWTSYNCSYRRNYMSDWDGVVSKCGILNGQVIYIKKIKIEYHQHVTHARWLCHIFWHVTYFNIMNYYIVL